MKPQITAIKVESPLPKVEINMHANSANVPELLKSIFDPLISAFEEAKSPILLEQLLSSFKDTVHLENLHLIFRSRVKRNLGKLENIWLHICIIFVPLVIQSLQLKLLLFLLVSHILYSVMQRKWVIKKEFSL